MPISTEEQHYAGRLEQVIEFKTRRVKRLNRIKNIALIDEWPALKEELESSAKSGEDLNTLDLEKDEGSDFNATAELMQLKKRAAACRAYRGIIFIIEHADDRARVINEEIAEHRRKFRELQEKTNTNGTQTEKHRRNIA